MADIEKYAKDLISLIDNDNPKNEILSCWNKLACHINFYASYDDIPNVYIVSTALYKFCKKFTNKDAEEEFIRLLLVFCLLKRAIDTSIGQEKALSSIRLVLMINSKLKYLVRVFRYTLPEKDYNYALFDYPKLSQEQINIVQHNYNSIKLYLYNLGKQEINNIHKEDIIKTFKGWSESFFNCVGQKICTDISYSHGETLLDICCNKIKNFGKFTLYALDKDASEFYNKTKGLIKSDFTFYAESYLITERGHWSEGDTCSTFKIEMDNNDFKIAVLGIKEDYIRPYLCQPITHIVVEKLKNSVEIQLEHRLARGDGENVPMDINIVMENNIVTSIEFFFIVGKEGWPRRIFFYGKNV